MHLNNPDVILRLTKLYSALALLTVVLLIVFSITAPRLATSDAWVHAIVVALFAIILPLRARGILDGKRSALRATGIIASVLFLVNIVEALIPNFMPVWMKIDMMVTAALLACIIGLVIYTAARKK